MKRTTYIWLAIMIILVVSVVWYVRQPARSTPASQPVITDTAPASKLPQRNVRDIIQPGQPIGNDKGSTSTTTP